MKKLQKDYFHDHIGEYQSIFTVPCLVAKPLERGVAKGDLDMIQSSVLFRCKLLRHFAHYILVPNTTRSPSASLQIKGLATKYITVKWPIEHLSDRMPVHNRVSHQGRLRRNGAAFTSIDPGSHSVTFNMAENIVS